ncbi:MAG: ice-binding family protein [Flavipsychrobacter sp.]|nr:ice-binding family protein [Flavipsychrobacter sp.]
MRENFYISDLPHPLCTTAKPSIHKRLKQKLSAFVVAAVLLTIPSTLFAQAPNLGTAANFVLFTGVGAVTHSGSSHITGNVGSNSGSSTGFGNVNGVMLNNNGATATCAADLLTAYNQLNTAIPTATPSSLLGNGTTLVAGVYHITSAATLNLALNLDGQGNPNALFIFQIDGSLSANSLSRVNLLNGALACNVFWKVEGLVSIATASTMRGNIIANNAAINIGTGDTLEGRALSTAGAISVSGVVAYTPIGCGSTYLTGPAAPALASTAAYGVFSGNGQVTNTGVTHITGDVGSNLGLTTGFNPLFVTGTIHPIPDASTAACAADLTNVYNYLNTIPYDIELLYPAQFGNDLTLTPHTYLMNAATTFTGAVYLDAEGDANAVFIIKINGALTSGTFSKVVLINGTQAKNVYWKIDGAVNIGANSLFNGTMVANNGAIQLGLNDTLNGRALTTDGAVTIQSSNITITTAACTAPPITGNNNLCPNSTTVLSNTTTGGRWSSSNPLVATIDSIFGTVRGINAGNTTITYVTSTACVSTMGFVVNPNPAPITGPGFVCSGSTITLNDITPNGTWTSSNVLQATVASTTGVVTGVSTGTPFITYTLNTGCVANKTISVNADGGTITGPSSVCTGTAIQLTDSIPGGTWSANNSRATVVNGLVTGITAGIDTITYSVTNTCGTAATSKIITINTMPTAGTIAGPSSVCVGSSITLTDAVTGGTWSASNTNATVVNGVVSGVTAGTDNITYTVTNTCGTTTANDLITINPLPNAGNITGPSSVCVGATVTLTDATAGGTWSASNTNATVLNGNVSGVTAGTDNIMYSVTNICGTAIATQAMTINPLPNAGSISGPSSVCVGSSITLTDATTGGTWSASNTSATVLNGVVSGVTAGTDNIIYSVTNVCGTATVTQAIIINPLPNAGTITGPTGVCYGASITLTDLATGGTWSTSNNNASVAGGTVTANTTGQDTIYYTVVNVCGTAIASHNVTVNPLPIVPAITTQAPANVCTDTKYQNFGTATPPPTGTAYNWTATNAKVWAQGLNRQYSLVTFDTTGNAYVMLHTTLTGTGCTNETTIPITVGTSIAEVPSVVYFNYHFVCTPNTENSYQWGYDDAITLDSTILTGEINQDYLNTNADFANKYYWVMTNMSGCLQKTYYTIPTVVQNVNSATSLSVYPNPTSSVVNVAISSAINGEMQVEIMNMTGQRLSMTTATNNKASVNVEMLPAGSYLVTCYRDGIKIAISKFTKN